MSIRCIVKEGELWILSCIIFNFYLLFLFDKIAMSRDCRVDLRAIKIAPQDCRVDLHAIKIVPRDCRVDLRAIEIVPRDCRVDVKKQEWKNFFKSYSAYVFFGGRGAFEEGTQPNLPLPTKLLSPDHHRCCCFSLGTVQCDRRPSIVAKESGTNNAAESGDEDSNIRCCNFPPLYCILSSLWCIPFFISPPPSHQLPQWN